MPQGEPEQRDVGGENLELFTLDHRQQGNAQVVFQSRPKFAFGLRFL